MRLPNSKYYIKKQIYDTDFYGCYCKDQQYIILYYFCLRGNNDSDSLILAISMNIFL